MSLVDQLKKFINIIDQLRDIGLDKQINLPRIVVLGTQSSGKSSLLESIVGIDFLPRGDGVVTRRPLELRLINVSLDKAPTPYGIFEEIKGKKFTDFDQVREQIVKLTDEVAGEKKGIVNIPIVLTIFSNSVPDLTLVDLPGITRIPLRGSDQPEDIEQITKDMALHYLKEQRTIILCVMPANQDMSTSDALKMARELDKNGIRTVGVLTKIDIMDRGTNAKKMLMGQEIALNLGYVGVKLRSQADIKEKQTVKQSLEKELQYFSQHPVYSTMQQGYLGIGSLTDKLSKILYQHIKRSMPSIMDELKQKINEKQQLLKDLGPALPSTETEKFQVLYQIVQQFTDTFKKQIDGKYSTKFNNSSSKDVPENVKFRQVFNEIFLDELKQDISSQYSDNDISMALTMHEGDQLPGFQSIDAFFYLIQPCLEKLLDPALECLNEVHYHLDKLAMRLIGQHCRKFPVIQAEIEERIQNLLEKQREMTRKIIKNNLEAEMGYLFTNDGTLETFSAQNNNKDPKKQLVQEMRHKLDTNVRDMVPKVVGHFYIKWLENNMQLEMLQQINNNSELKKMIEEPQEIIDERNNLINQIEVLQNATKIIKRDPDLADYIQYAKQEQVLVEQQKEKEMKSSQFQAQPITRQESIKIQKQILVDSPEQKDPTEQKSDPEVKQVIKVQNTTEQQESKKQASSKLFGMW